MRQSTKGWIALFSILAIVSVAVAFASVAASAYGFEESYGFAYTCGETCYVQSANAHTFDFNQGSTENGGYLACQLFNHEGVNVVTHGNGNCSESYNGGAFVWARIYNESGALLFVIGYAHTR